MSSSLDRLPWEQRKKYCYCKEGQSHCGVCSCGKHGHLRALMFCTDVWCDECFEQAFEEMNENQKTP